MTFHSLPFLKPRKDKLLAAVDDIMRFGNPNLRYASAPVHDDGERTFGPDRGRGGRVLRGAIGESNAPARGGGRGVRSQGQGTRGGARVGSGGSQRGRGGRGRRGSGAGARGQH